MPQPLGEHDRCTGPKISIGQMLRRASRPVHDRLEAALPLMSPQLSWAMYRDHIARLLPVVLATEAVVRPWSTHLAAMSGGGIDMCPRARLLIADAQALRCESSTAASHPMAHSPTLPQAVGCWYVLGGSRIGGQVICRHLVRVLGPTAAPGSSYYRSCSAHDARLFKTFLHAIDAHSELVRCRDEVIKAALTTFSFWSQFLMDPI